MIDLLDSTLREGAQADGISFSIEDKLSVAQALCDIGIKYIEAGNPSSNPKDMEFFNRAKKLDLKNSVLCAFSPTCRKDIAAKDDPAIDTLIKTGVSTAVIFGKANSAHVENVIKTSRKENLRMIEDTVSYLVSSGLEVIFDAEHFFSGCAEDEEYAVNTLKSAADAGASTIVLCDSNGGADFFEVGEKVREITEILTAVKTGVHIHNDSDVAVAASIAAVTAGARHVQGSFNGYGERCGLASLSSIIAGLQLKKNIKCIFGDVKDLTRTAARIAETANMSLPRTSPYVGAAAYSHKAGMHVDAMYKLSGAYEDIDPSLVGNRRKILLSEISGKQAVVKKLTDMFPCLKKDSGEAEAITKELKRLESEGYQFEGADASFYLLASRIMGTYEPHFETLHYRTSGEFPAISDNYASALVQIKVKDSEETGAALGNGPVNALDAALRKALTVFYPSLEDMRLTDYKVRVLASGEATASRVRVLITSENGNSSWTTVGVSTDIIKASFLALCDSIEYYLGAKEENRHGNDNDPKDLSRKMR